MGARKGGSKTTANRTREGKVAEARGEADNGAGSVEGRRAQCLLHDEVRKPGIRHVERSQFAPTPCPTHSHATMSSNQIPQNPGDCQRQEKTKSYPRAVRQLVFDDRFTKSYIRATHIINFFNI